VIFEARPKAGGLNEYGIASYKTVDDFAQREVAWLLGIGGIELRCGVQLGRDVMLDGLRADFDAVFLALGLTGVNALGIPEPEAPGLRAAVDFIAELRQASDLAKLPVGRDVVVIGGGMTAIDAAVQCKLLGAQTATIVYRRGPQSMSASQQEQDWAQHNGVAIRHWAAPQTVLTDGDGEGAQITGLRLVHTALQGDKLVETGDTFTLPADMVLRAIGQTFEPGPVPGIALKQGRIHTDDQGRTNVAGVWAGGDCRFGGRDLTVEAVEDGKVAARSIHAALMT
jgi:dihydropyrimidine dehydrogenase (NAD+) subunit PreT